MAIDVDEGQTGNTAKFERGGDKHGGKILDADQRQDRDFDTGQPKTWDDGRPIIIWVITVAEGDEEVTLWARGGNFEVNKGKGESMMEAIRTAVHAAGATQVLAGGELTVEFTGLGKVKKVGMNPPKLYTATYKPPAQGFDTGTSGGDDFTGSAGGDGDDLFSDDEEPF